MSTIVSIIFGFENNSLIAGAVFVLAGAPLYGYYTRVIQQAMDQEEIPPQFTNWRALLRTGWKASIVTLLFFYFPETWLSTAFGPVFSGFAEVFSVDTVNIPASSTGRQYPLSVAGLLVGAFILPIVMGNFARRERLSDVVDFEQYSKIFTSKQYIRLAVALIILNIIRQLYLLLIVLFIGGFDMTSANIGLTLLYLVLFLSILPAMAVGDVYIRVAIYYSVGNYWRCLPGVQDKRKLLHDSTKTLRLDNVDWDRYGKR